MPKVTDILKDAYVDEIETVANYLALSHTLDGVKAAQIKDALAEDVNEELSHAKALAARLKEVGDAPPASVDMDFTQDMLRAPANTTDLTSVVKGVLKAEERAITTYRNLINAAKEADDFVTEDLGMKILGDEEKHRTLFEGYLKELTGETGVREREQAAR
jgi:bacterioferritin